MTRAVGVFEAAQERFEIDGPTGRLELAAHAAKQEAVLSDAGLMAVVCHPHPQHGGTMDNKVVTTLVRTYRDLGVPAVCFNFRGVGASEGEFDHAVGEVDDLLTVTAWLQRCYPDRRLLVAGFSFGSSVAAQASHQLAGQIAHLTLVAPPVERYVYDQDGRFPCPLAVIIGEQDELVDVEGVYRWVDGLIEPAQLLRYPQASHFFHGALVALKNDLSHILVVELAKG